MERVMQVEVIRTGEAPDYRPLARALLQKIRACLDDPEYMKEYEKWKKAREAGD